MTDIDALIERLRGLHEQTSVVGGGPYFGTAFKDAAAALERMRDELAETTEAFQDQMTATATYMDKMEAAEAEVARLREALEELVDIVQDAIEQQSTKNMDSFTLQPARAALAQRSK